MGEGAYKIKDAAQRAGVTPELLRAWQIRYGMLGRESVIETFFDRNNSSAHADFQRWREQHFEDVYFLNCKGPNDVMLHRSASPQ